MILDQKKEETQSLLLLLFGFHNTTAILASSALTPAPCLSPSPPRIAHLDSYLIS